MRSLQAALLTIVAAVSFPGCAGFAYDPVQPTPFVSGPYINWTEPPPAAEYNRGYWEEKFRVAEQRRWEANRNAYDAGRNRARQEELERGGWMR